MTLNKAYKRIDNDMRKYTVVAVAGAFALCLHDKYGFGRKRLGSLLRDVMNTFNAINENYTTVEDILKTVRRETGLDVSDFK